MSCSSIKEYGKYLQVNVLVSNGSLEPIMISTENIVAGTSVDGKEELKPLEVLSCDEYMQKVKRRQNVASAFNGLAQGLAAANAGYSSSYTNTNYYGTSNTTANAYAYGSGGYAYGHLNSNTTNIGTISTSTREYDGFKAYQAQQIASANIASYDMALLENRNILQAGYLKSNTVQPGETISGYANIKYTKGSLYVSIKIGGASYFFSWK